jgi:multidrug resistance efflux pump
VLDNQQVREGQVLFQIDPRPYQISVDQTRAAVQGLEAELSVIKSEVASQTSGAAAAATGINTAIAQLEFAASTLNRMQPLLARGFVTAEQVDQARTAKETEVAAGEFADAGHPLFTIINTEHWYAIGNFRETDLAGIKPGSARSSLLWRNRTFRYTARSTASAGAWRQVAAPPSAVCRMLKAPSTGCGSRRASQCGSFSMTRPRN